LTESPAPISGFRKWERVGHEGKRDFSRLPFQTEPTIAVNPRNPDHIVVGVIDYNSEPSHPVDIFTNTGGLGDSIGCPSPSAAAT
jgi:hypothetical protein